MHGAANSFGDLELISAVEALPLAGNADNISGATSRTPNLLPPNPLTILE